MADFAKLKTQTKKTTPTHPLEIFRRLAKPPGINDLYISQAEVLEAWYQRRTHADVVVKLHTGGGKTLVGLLLAQSTVNEGTCSLPDAHHSTGEPDRREGRARANARPDAQVAALENSNVPAERVIDSKSSDPSSRVASDVM